MFMVASLAQLSLLTLNHQWPLQINTCCMKQCRRFVRNVKSCVFRSIISPHINFPKSGYLMKTQYRRFYLCFESGLVGSQNYLHILPTIARTCSLKQCRITYTLSQISHTMSGVMAPVIRENSYNLKNLKTNTTPKQVTIGAQVFYVGNCVRYGT